MQNTFIVPAMQHGCRAKPLLRRLDKSQSNFVIVVVTCGNWHVLLVAVISSRVL